jgi:NAD(P)-dependent dehydrogenase (short-subunit alcohol dehydrogenase family)
MQMPKAALVTGGAVRIGAGLVRALAARGFAVAIHYRRSREAALAVAEEIKAAGGHACTLTADLAVADEVEALVPAACAALGPLGLLVNNASIFEDDRLPNVSAASLSMHFGVNTTAPVLLAQALARQLPDNAEGLVVNLIDQRIWKLTPQFVSYTLSKVALFAATKTMAQALAPKVRVVGFAPGPTLPNATEGEAGLAKEIAGTLLGRGPTAQDFAAALDFVLTARSVTGQTIALNGGQHLAWRTPDIVD